MEQLFSYCEQGQVDQVKKFIDNEKTIFLKCVDPNTGDTALHKCINVKCAELVLENNNQLLNRENKNNDTPLMKAIQQGLSSELCQFFLKNGADATKLNKDNQTALHLSALHCREDVFEDIVDHMASSADFDIVDSKGYAIIHYVVQQKPEQANRMLRKMLAKNSVDVDALDKNDRTAFLVAAQMGNIEACQLLSDNNCKLTAQDEQGTNALQCAAATGNTKMIQYLIKDLSLPVDQGDKIGRTALFYAVFHNKPEAVELLLSLHSNVDHLDKSHKSAVHVAASTGSDVCLRKLISGKADIWLRDQDNRFALHYAAEKGYKTVVRILLTEDNASSHINTKDKHGRTAKELAKTNGFKECVSLIEKYSPYKENVEETEKQKPHKKVEIIDPKVDKESPREEKSPRPTSPVKHDESSKHENNNIKEENDNKEEKISQRPVSPIEKKEETTKDEEKEKSHDKTKKKRERKDSSSSSSSSSSNSSKPKSNVNEEIKSEYGSDDDPYVKSNRPSKNSSAKDKKTNNAFLEQLTSKYENEVAQKPKKKPVPGHLKKLRESLRQYNSIVVDGRMRHSALRDDMRYKRHSKISPERQISTVIAKIVDKENRDAKKKKRRTKEAKKEEAEETIDKAQLQERLDKITTDTNDLLEESKTENQEQQRLLKSRGDSRPTSSMGKSPRPISARPKSTASYISQKPYVRPNSASRYMCYLPNIPQPSARFGRPKSGRNDIAKDKE